MPRRLRGVLGQAETLSHLGDPAPAGKRLENNHERDDAKEQDRGEQHAAVGDIHRLKPAQECRHTPDLGPHLPIRCSARRLVRA
jgi:hypothetical protein